MMNNPHVPLDSPSNRSSEQSIPLGNQQPLPKSAQLYERRQANKRLELQELKQKEKELIEALENVNTALSDLGIPSSLLYSDDTFIKEEGRRKHAQQPTNDRLQKAGLTFPSNQNCLSFRGEDKAREYFQFLDMNSDSYLGYSEFREMQSFQHRYGLIKDPAYQSNIAWKIMMLNKGYSLDLIHPQDHPTSHRTVNHSSNNSSSGSTVPPAQPQLDIEGFVKYRQELEKKQPLARELEYLGLPLLPSYLIEWKKLKSLIKETMDIRPFVKTMTKEDIIELKGYVTIDEMLFVVNNLGFNFTKPELTLLMLWRRRKANVLIHLLRVYSKHNLSQQEYSFEINPKNESLLLVQYDERESIITVEKINKVKIEEFIAWFLACPKFINFEKLWYRRIMKWKYWIYRGIRSVDRSCRFLFTLAAHINDRLLLRDFLPINKLSKYLQEVITWKVSADLGNLELNPIASERYPGISCSWKLLKLENPETMLKSYNIPQGSSTVIILEFLLKPEISLSQQELLIDLLRNCLMNSFEKELKNNNINFNGIQLNCLVNEIDENFVLRIMISYKKVVSIDRFFEHLLLEYRIYDLVTVFLGDIRTNFNIQNYLQHHLTRLNDSLSIQFSTTLAMRKNLVMAIIKRLMLGFSSGLTEEQANSLNNPNDPAIDKKAMSEQEKQSIQSTSNNMMKLSSQQSSKPMKSLTSITSKHKKGKIQVVTKNTQFEQEEELIRYDRWKMIYPYYNQLKDRLESILLTWKSFQTSIFRYSFRNLADFRQKMAILWREYSWLTSLFPSSAGESVLDEKERKRGVGSDAEEGDNNKEKGIFYELYHWISDQFLNEKGYFYHHYKEFQEEFQYEIGLLFQKLKEFLEQRKKEEDERRLKALITIVPNADNSGDQQDYMKAQLLNTAGSMKNGQKVIDEDDIDNPVDYIEQLEIKQRFQDITNLRLLELCKENIIGVNTIDIISGKSKFSLVIQDFDPMELIPLIHSLSSTTVGMKEADVKKNHRGEKKETMQQIFQRTSISRNKQSRTQTPATAVGNTVAGKNAGSNALMATVASFGDF